MLSAVATDIVVVIHFLWIIFIIGGFPFFLYVNSTTGRVLHLIALLVTAGMQATGTICPLTYLEAFLKSKGSGHPGHPGSFIIGKLESLIYVEDTTLEIISWLTMAFLLVALLSFRFRPLRKKEGLVDLPDHDRREPQRQPGEEGNEDHPDDLEDDERNRPPDNV
jgi:hypothetical protein